MENRLESKFWDKITSVKEGEDEINGHLVIKVSDGKELIAGALNRINFEFYPNSNFNNMSLVSKFLNYLEARISTVKNLYVTSCNFGFSTGLLELLSLLSKKASLNKLYLGDNRFMNSTDAQALARYLKNNETLSEIDLSNHMFGQEDRLTIISSLGENKKLTHFNFSSYYSQVTAADLEVFKKVYKINKTLTHLTIQLSNEKGICEALGAMLSENTTIKSLTLINVGTMSEDMQKQLFTEIEKSQKSNMTLSEVICLETSHSIPIVSRYYESAVKRISNLNYSNLIVCLPNQVAHKITDDPRGKMKVPVDQSTSNSNSNSLPPIVTYHPYTVEEARKELDATTPDPRVEVTETLDGLIVRANGRDKFDHITAIIKNGQLKIEISSGVKSVKLFNAFFSKLDPYIKDIHSINLQNSCLGTSHPWSGHYGDFSEVFGHFSNYQFSHINLNDTDLRDPEHAKVLVNYLNASKNLEVLELDQHGFPQDDRTKILEAIQKFSLTKLTFVGDKIGGRVGGTACSTSDIHLLKEHCKVNDKLIHLEISLLVLEDRIFETFRDFLRENTSITSLVIVGTYTAFDPDTPKLLKALEEALESNMVLTQIEYRLTKNCYSRTPIPKQMLTNIEAALKRNKSRSSIAAMDIVTVTPPISQGAQLSANPSGSGASGNSMKLKKGIRQIDPNDIERKDILAKGAQGTVYKGFWKSENREVAVKKPHSMDELTAKMLKREIEVVAGIRHQNIAGFYGYMEGPFAIVMELANLGDLYTYEMSPDYLQTSWSRIADFALGIAQGLDFLHQRGAVHRDLKPHNILLHKELDENSNVKIYVRIADFGLARQLNTEETVTMGKMGTPGYMAYEISVEQEKFTLKSDVFSFAVVLYGMVNFGEENSQRKYIPLPKNFQAIINKAGAKETNLIAPISKECHENAPEVEAMILNNWYSDPNRRMESKDIVIALVAARDRMLTDEAKSNSDSDPFTMLDDEGKTYYPTMKTT